MDTDWDAPVVSMKSDKEIVAMVRNGCTEGEGKGGSCSEEEKGESQALILTEKCTEFATALTEGLEQRHDFNEQKLIFVYMMRERLITE